MKKLLNKTWFTGILITGLLITIFFLNFWIMSLDLSWSFLSENFLQLRISNFDDDPIYIFAFILMIVFYLSIIPLVLSMISIIKKKNWGFIIAGLVFFGFSVSLIVFQTLTSYLPLLAMGITIVNLLLTLCVFTLIIVRNKTLNKDVVLTKDEREMKLKNSKIPLVVLLVDVIAITIFITTFFIPLYTEIDSGITYNAVLANVLIQGDTHEIAMIYFFVNFAIFLGIFLYFADSLSNYIVNKTRFMLQSKRLVVLTFIATAVFFLAGLVIKIYFMITWGISLTSIAYIPLLLMFVLVLLFSLLTGKYKDVIHIASGEKKSKYYSIEPLLYVVLLTAVTVCMLFLPIINIDITSNAVSYDINLTGFGILKNYASLDSGTRLLAYFLVVVLISVALCLVITLASYLSKSKLFKSLVKFTTSINIFFIFIVSVSGYYFQIAREINLSIIENIANLYGITSLDFSSVDYVIGTDTIYALIVAIFVLIIMFARKTFDREDFTQVEAEVLSSGNKSSVASEEIEETEIQNFDPCYSFTELDSKKDLFKKELQERKALIKKDATLNGLVNFVVDYARNSRLHLSYKPETIATFVSGLGAAKLSILQGMSGTGKTSLPKIFAEAIYGNCDIIEVESSWKDKNELLGYYNEFSMHYTPKKFTLALYKAALNQEVFTFILLDEMNLSRIEYYFSDFLSLMENEEEDREIKLVNINLNRKEDGKDIEYLALENGHTLKVPANVWFIGTANRDESTFVISDKVYDRAHTMNFTKRAPKVRNYKDPIAREYYDYKTMNNLFESAKEKGDFDAENSELIRSIEKLLAPYNISFGNRILKQIEDFVNIYKECFVNDDVESEAIEKILLSKVVAKLEVKTIEDKEQLEIEFEKLNLHQCAEFIKHLDED